jgi:hypothetical protein
MHTRIGIVLTAAALALGCAHRAEEHRPAPHAYRAESHVDWTMLGERWVDGRHDRDVIWVGAREGAYRRIMIVVEHSALEMDGLVVHFSDGSAFAPETRHVFAANTRSHVIDLPGTRRTIRSVEFSYGNLPGHGRAHAEVWAD